MMHPECVLQCGVCKQPSPFQGPSAATLRLGTWEAFGFGTQIQHEAWEKGASSTDMLWASPAAPTATVTSLLRDSQSSLGSLLGALGVGQGRDQIFWRAAGVLVGMWHSFA